MKLDMNKVESFAGQVVTDISAAFSGVMTNIGHKLGLYKAMAGAGPLTPKELALKTGTHPRYVQEWLNNQVAGQYVTYDSDTETYHLPDEHVPVLADEDSPVFLVPALDVASSLWLDEGKVMDVFRSGKGIAWSEHHHRLFCGSEALFRPGYKAHLSAEWIRSLDGVEDKLMAGAKVADVGCGHGASTIVMAQEFPESTFYGFDSHAKSIEIAKERAREAGVEANTRFMVATSKNYEENGFDLICFMDCLHDMGDPVGAARHARAALNGDGSVLLVEPAAGDSLESNINPVSRLYYAASTAVCTPCSLSQEVGLALGAQAGEKRLSEVMGEAGFKKTRRTAETPFNIILDVRAA
ncbi:MAG: class I SAM-dependent methyltransferase [Acidobacteria bacterium]|uniref:Class I SAM-dependent methyltransferase n=1 Tax=Candidatus Polarisedimenticola svalbardensis TaxID=2886004 RepID=A0A8J6Y4U0_9BACT|nr:class I SAM-dependent methyltransferase [Candidatus Polarisedimenticola svalbardensis]